MKQKWQEPTVSIVPINLDELGDVSQLSDADLKIKLEQAGYPFQKPYQASEHFVHRKVADSDVLISIGSNIADFNGYIEINPSAALLWTRMQTPCRLHDLEQTLEEAYGISHRQAVEDVLDFLKELMEHRMVVVS